MSTVHLMGKGYWVWLIPLGSGSTSIGIVADNDLHPYARINRYDRAVEWLREFRRKNPLPPPTGLKADKAFYDEMWGEDAD